MTSLELVKMAAHVESKHFADFCVNRAVEIRKKKEKSLSLVNQGQWGKKKIVVYFAAFLPYRTEAQYAVGKMSVVSTSPRSNLYVFISTKADLRTRSERGRSNVSKRRCLKSEQSRDDGV